MAKVHPEIDSSLGAWIAAQSVFFVASAPLSGAGHVNLSPRGLDTLRVLGPHRVAFLDLTGSGNETAAHLAENGRITVMLCAFSGDPLILRLYGRGEVVLPDDPRWRELRCRFPDYPGERQIIVVDVQRIQTSCGFGVPLMQPLDDRSALTEWAAKKGDQLAGYRQRNNARSIDGLAAPGLDSPPQE